MDWWPIRVKKYAVSKISGFVWTEPKPCLVPVRRLPRPSQSMHFGEKFLGPRDPKHIGRAQKWGLEPKLSPLGIGLFCCKSFFCYYLKWRRFLFDWAVKSYSASPMWQRVIFFFWQKNSAKFILCIYQCSELANRLNCSPSKRIGRLLVLILKCMDAYMELWNNNKNGIIHLESNQTNQQTH